MPSLVSIPHPLVADERALCFAEFLPRETLRAYIERTGVVVAKGPVAVWHNGYRVPDDLWDRLIPRRGDQIIIRARAQGGGGGNKVLRTVALVVVAIASAGAASAASTAALSAGASTAGATAVGAAVSAAVMIGGSILVNALIPLPKPNLATTADGSVDNSPSYQIQASRNTARQWEPMMLVMGGPIKVVPDLGSNPSTSYVGDDQYLSQIFHFGLQTDLVIDDVRIGDTPIFDFQGVQMERSGPDGVITLAPDNVDTIQGFDLNQPDGWNSRTTPVDTNYFEIEVATVCYSLDTMTGKFLPRTVEFQIEYRNVNSETWTPLGSYTDPVYATHYWALGVYEVPNYDSSTIADATWHQVAYGSLNPNDHVNGERYQVCESWGGGDYGTVISCKTYEWRWLPHPFQLGRPWQGIAPDPLIQYVTTEGNRLTGDSNKPVRQTYSASVPLGQYEIRVRKISEDLNTNTDSNVTSVTQIRAYQYTPTDYSDQVRLAVRIRATSQLNGPIDELSATCWAMCNQWDGTKWVYGPTRNPAWWFLWFALGKRNSAGEKVYGACIPESQIDIESIKAWAAYCDLMGWKFDYILAQKMSAHDVLTLIARAGQASYTWQSGKLGVIWDAANQPVVAMIGPYNIKAGTFEVSYVDGTVDEIIGNFINKDRNWQADQVRVRVPGAPILNNPQTFDLEGIVDAGVAGRVVNLLAASQNFHRRRVTWEMDIEGYIATRGDVVQLSHDLTVWGYAGRLVGGNRSVLVLDRTVPINGTGFFQLRGPGNQMVMLSVSGIGDTDTLTILNPAALTSFPMPGDQGYEDVPALDWAWQFDLLQTPGRRLKIVSVQPTNDDGVRFEAVDDSIDYYNSINNPFIYAPPRDGALLRGVVLALAFEETILNVKSDVIELRLDWVVSATSKVRIDYQVNGVAFPSVSTSDRYFTLQAHTGDSVSVTVTPVGVTGLGIAKSGTWTIVGLAAPLPPVTGLTNVFRDGLTWLSWMRVDDIREPSYEIRLGPTQTNARVIGVTESLESLAVGNGLYWVFARFTLSNGAVIYGPPDSILIAGATLVRNVLVAQDEAPKWDGTLSDGAYVYDGKLTLAPQGDILGLADVLAEQDILWYGGPASSGIYTNAEAEQVDIGYVTPVRVDFDIEVEARNITADIMIVPDIFAVADVLNGSDLLKITVTPQIRTAVVEGDWTEWRNYVPGLVNARYFDARVLIATSDPLIIPFVSKFEWTIDVPDLLQRAEGVAIPVGGMRITYAKRFHAVPNVQVTILDALNGDRAVLIDSDDEGFDIEVINGSTSVERKINWISQGF
ncbi:hypothetical protein CAL13_08910 [Bordetella genomosp. 9]|uniref:Tip attachment protein J domain-containing protein n=1 Tax=Bordetella genomosp. 9 TaxID=1416803 RepID=A0A1W6Z5I3_9BORD|nr:hypothetical protein CAL13_08910 [Bordetella genomosp. 9]